MGVVVVVLVFFKKKKRNFTFFHFKNSCKLYKKKVDSVGSLDVGWTFKFLKVLSNIYDLTS